MTVLRAARRSRMETARLPTRFKPRTAGPVFYRVIKPTPLSPYPRANVSVIVTVPPATRSSRSLGRTCDVRRPPPDRGHDLFHARPSKTMNSSHSTRATYVAAFLLGSLFALIAARPARATEPLRLDRVGVVQFTAEPGGCCDARAACSSRTAGRFGARRSRCPAQPTRPNARSVVPSSPTPPG